MKSELSSLELYYLQKEFQVLISGKVEQIYQLAKEELTIQMHVPGKGKHILRAILGKVIYLARAKGEIPQKPPGLCLHLRKKLKNARLREVRQVGFERVLEFLFETKDCKYRLIIEMFSKGNVILCDEAGIILSVLQLQDWKDRILRPKREYLPPKKDVDFLDINSESLRKVLTASDKENLVKALAIELGIGGVYAEELCLRSGLDKYVLPAALSDAELSSLNDAIEKIKSKEISAMVVFADKEHTEVKDVVPFPLLRYKDFETESKESFNIALDSVFTVVKESRELDAAHSAAEAKLDKVSEIIRQQEQRIEGLERSAEENSKKGEYIYENYPLVKQILDEIIAMRQTMSWKAVEDKIRHNKIIKGVDTKTGEVTVEI